LDFALVAFKLDSAATGVEKPVRILHAKRKEFQFSLKSSREKSISIIATQFSIKNHNSKVSRPQQQQQQLAILILNILLQKYRSVT
jgi:hypothetical protein